MEKHIKNMQIYTAFKEENLRKELFNKSIVQLMPNYDYQNIKNILQIEVNTQIVLFDALRDIAHKSLEETPLYNFLKIGNLDFMKKTIEQEDFQYSLYHIDDYSNIIKKTTNHFFNPKKESKEIVSLLIGKSIEHSFKTTIETCNFLNTPRPKGRGFLLH